MESLSKAGPKIEILESDSAEHLRRIKRRLVVDLFLRQGPLWKLVHGLRNRRGIVAMSQLPPSHSLKYKNLLLPEGSPNPPEPIGLPPKEEELNKEWRLQAEKLDEFARQWRHDLIAILEQVVPDCYLGGPLYGHIEYEAWQNFAAACVLYDPPDAELPAFAEFCDPPAYSVRLPGGSQSMTEREKFVAMPLPPIRTLRDPHAERMAEARYWERIVEEIGRRCLEPLGLDVNAVVLDIIENSPEMLSDETDTNQRGGLRYYIEVSEHTSGRDVRHAFRTIAATQERPRNPKPKRDPLIAVQSAILYDKHNGKDPEDSRRKKWTYEKLARKFELPSARSAGAHVEEGRRLLQNKPKPQE